MLELSLCVLLLKLAFYIALLILEVLHLVALGLHLTFSLKSSLHPRLNFKRVLFEQSQLLHELVFLLNELLIAHRKLFSVFSAHLQLSFQLTHLLSQLVSLELAASVILHHLSLILRRRLQTRLHVVQLQDLPLHLKLLTL